MKIHHVQRIGESLWTDCGIPASNNWNAVTQEGEVTCKKCLKIKFANCVRSEK